MLIRLILIILCIFITGCANSNSQINNTIIFENQEFYILKDYGDSLKIISADPIFLSHWDNKDITIDRGNYMDYKNSVADFLCNEYFKGLSDKAKNNIIIQNVIQTYYHIDTHETNKSSLINKYMCINDNNCNIYSFEPMKNKNIGKRYIRLPTLDDFVEYWGNNVYDYEIQLLFNESEIWLLDASADLNNSVLKINGSAGLISMYTYIFDSEIRPVIIVNKNYFKED